jgi:hypothetical protein
MSRTHRIGVTFSIMVMARLRQVVRLAAIVCGKQPLEYVPCPLGQFAFFRAPEKLRRMAVLSRSRSRKVPERLVYLQRGLTFWRSGVHTCEAARPGRSAGQRSPSRREMHPRALALSAEVGFTRLRPTHDAEIGHARFRLQERREGADRASRNVDRLGITGMVSIPGCARGPNVIWRQC